MKERHAVDEHCVVQSCLTEPNRQMVVTLWGGYLLESLHGQEAYIVEGNSWSHAYLGWGFPEDKAGRVYRGSCSC